MTLKKLVRNLLRASKWLLRRGGLAIGSGLSSKEEAMASLLASSVQYGPSMITAALRSQVYGKASQVLRVAAEEKKGRVQDESPI